MRLRGIAVAAALSLAVFSGAAADEIDRIFIEQARKFVAANPLIARPSTPAEIARLGLRLEGLKNMVGLAGRGVLPDDIAFQMKRRLAIHSDIVRGVYDFERVEHRLARLLKMHATVARARLEQKTDQRTYLEIADYAVVAARRLARQIDPGMVALPVPDTSGWGPPK